jgi:hypothetical protein
MSTAGDRRRVHGDGGKRWVSDVHLPALRELLTVIDAESQVKETRKMRYVYAKDLKVNDKFRFAEGWHVAKEIVVGTSKVAVVITAPDKFVEFTPFTEILAEGGPDAPTPERKMEPGINYEFREKWAGAKAKADEGFVRAVLADEHGVVLYRGEWAFGLAAATYRLTTLLGREILKANAEK